MNIYNKTATPRLAQLRYVLLYHCITSTTSVLLKCLKLLGRRYLTGCAWGLLLLGKAVKGVVPPLNHLGTSFNNIVRTQKRISWFFKIMYKSESVTTNTKQNSNLFDKHKQRSIVFTTPPSGGKGLGQLWPSGAGTLSLRRLRGMLRLRGSLWEFNPLFDHLSSHRVCSKSVLINRCRERSLHHQPPSTDGCTNMYRGRDGEADVPSTEDADPLKEESWQVCAFYLLR